MELSEEQIVQEEQLVGQNEWNKTLLVYLGLTIFAIFVGRELINFVFVGLAAAMLSYAYVSMYLVSYTKLITTMLVHAVALCLWIIWALIPLPVELRWSTGLAALIMLCLGIPLLNSMELKSISGRYYLASAMLIVMLTFAYAPVAKLEESPLIISVAFGHIGLIIFYMARGMADIHDMEPPGSPSLVFRTSGLIVGIIAIVIDVLFMSLLTVAVST